MGKADLLETKDLASPPALLLLPFLPFLLFSLPSFVLETKESTLNMTILFDAKQEYSFGHKLHV